MGQAASSHGLQFTRDGFAIQKRFATPFVVAPVHEPDALNQDLTAVIMSRAAQQAGVVVSNVGGWQSEADFEAWSGAPGLALLAAAQDLANTVTAIEVDGQLRAGGPQWQVNAWANINRPGDSNHSHHHPAAFWSGVYWVDDGQDAEDRRGGEFEMHDPRGVLPSFYAPRLRYAVKGALSAGGEDFFTPRTGLMALFPSWLVHSVRPHGGPRSRISVAFNLSV